jgi:hypothetical protein
MNSFRICNSSWLEFSYQYVKASRVGMTDDDYEGRLLSIFHIALLSGSALIRVAYMGTFIYTGLYNKLHKM